MPSSPPRARLTRWKEALLGFRGGSLDNNNRRRSTEGPPATAPVAQPPPTEPHPGGWPAALPGKRQSEETKDLRICPPNPDAQSPPLRRHRGHQKQELP